MVPWAVGGGRLLACLSQQVQDQDRGVHNDRDRVGRDRVDPAAVSEAAEKRPLEGTERH